MERERRITVRVTEELHRAVRIRVAEKGWAISDVVRTLLRAWLAGEIDLSSLTDPEEEVEPQV